MENTNAAINDREMHLSRTLNAPIGLVWEVWTQPEHISQWWGPIGFTTTIEKMELRAGGAWNLIMHGPDGRNYINESVFTELIPMQRIVFEHVSYPKFTAIIRFEARGAQTHIHWRMIFESRELLENVVRTFGADRGLTENFIKMADYLSGMHR